ncbi:addiction module protein [Luteolibacter arcticus]|uniref:Addiction module protein n=1 Tax=Luteolibacter arcticus TaxID=1581411 RepID=A0ABT3GE58_9BACT|nr:addiction module protein [Luteolibacter arcticus]MCW1921726.1 addiction module protein [Luteolibacter arcticus]
MATTVDLETMTTADKLRLMEDIWQDLSAQKNEIVSPDWHGDVLAERERLTASGEEKFIPWDSAKKQLRDELT